MDSDLAVALVFGVLCIGFVLVLVLALPIYQFTVGFRRRRATQEYVAATEPTLQHLVRTNLQSADHSGGTTLVLGAVAYAADAPSRLASQWRGIFGGKLESLTDQATLARQLAYIRMLQDAQRYGAIGVANVRFETSELFSGRRQNAALIIEMLAYGTALLPTSGAEAAPSATQPRR
jgi:uncharacterized protein YbjQ (UPF0145 family)